MQLKPKSPKCVRGQLALATCGLLAGTAHAADALDTSWKLDSALLYYTEKDRVHITEPTVHLKKALADDEFLTVRVVFDSMSGASPSGATITNKPQTFTSPSGNSVDTIAAGKFPTRSFTDTRYAIGADWEKSLGRMTRNILTGNLSTETDYASVGVSDTVAHDFNNRLTTISVGLGASYDTVSPVGGAPVALGVVPTPPSLGGDAGSSNNKTNVDALVGITQVLTPRALTQLNFSHSNLNGYLTDPYKILSVVDPVTGETLDYRFEKRPSTRSTNAVFWSLAYHLPHDVVHFSYRYFWDDWGIKANTADLRYRFELAAGSYLEPHLRYYSQSAADFYRHSLVSGQPLPEFASADYRLAEMQGNTIGLKFGMPTSKLGEWSVRVERMVQTGNSHPTDAIGIQRNYDLYPKLDVTTLMISYSTRF